LRAIPLKTVGIKKDIFKIVEGLPKSMEGYNWQKYVHFSGENVVKGECYC